jgi:hypothetical protein
MYQKASAQGGAQADTQSADGPDTETAKKDKDDVVEAEFEEVKE